MYLLKTFGGIHTVFLFDNSYIQQYLYNFKVLVETESMTYRLYTFKLTALILNESLFT